MKLRQHTKRLISLLVALAMVLGTSLSPLAGTVSTVSAAEELDTATPTDATLMANEVLTVENSVKCTIENEGDSQYVDISVSESGWYFIYLVRDTGNNASLKFYDENDNYLTYITAYDSNSGDYLYLEEDVNYYICACLYWGDETGSFTISMEKSDCPYNVVGTLTYGQDLSVTLEGANNNANACYELNIEKAGWYKISSKIDDDSSVTSISSDLYNSYSMQCGYDGGESFAINEYLKAGTYYLCVDANFTGESASFYISLEDGDEPEELKLDSYVECDVMSYEYYTYYKINVDTTAKYTIYSEGDYDTYVYLYDENFNQIEYDDDSGEEYNFSLTYKFEAGKTYYIYVSVWDDDGGTFNVYFTEKEFDTSDIAAYMDFDNITYDVTYDYAAHVEAYIPVSSDIDWANTYISSYTYLYVMTSDLNYYQELYFDSYNAEKSALVFSGDFSTTYLEDDQTYYLKDMQMYITFGGEYRSLYFYFLESYTGCTDFYYERSASIYIDTIPCFTIEMADPIVLTLGQEFTVVGGLSYKVSFTPEETGCYVFDYETTDYYESISYSDWFTYDEETGYVNFLYDYDEELEAGTTYYAYMDAYGDLTAWLIKYEPNVSISSYEITCDVEYACQNVTALATIDMNVYGAAKVQFLYENENYDSLYLYCYIYESGEKEYELSGYLPTTGTYTLYYIYVSDGASSWYYYYNSNYSGKSINNIFGDALSNSEEAFTITADTTFQDYLNSLEYGSVVDVDYLYLYTGYNLTELVIPEGITVNANIVEVYQNCTLTVNGTLNANRYAYVSSSGSLTVNGTFYASELSMYTTPTLGENGVILSDEAYVDYDVLSYVTGVDFNSSACAYVNSLDYYYFWRKGAWSKSTECVHEYESAITSCVDGEITYTCKECGDSYTEVITGTADHTYDAGVVTVAATTTSEGVMTYTCTVCGATKTESIDMLTEEESGSGSGDDEDDGSGSTTSGSSSSSGSTGSSSSSSSSTSDTSGSTSSDATTTTKLSIGDTYTKDGITYKVTAAKKMTVIKGDKSLTTVSISKTIKVGSTTYTIVGIGDRAFKKCKKLTSITLPSTVTSIGSAAFANCSNLKKVTIKGKITAISAKTFYGCTKLTTVTVPNTVKTVGARAFAKCKSLKTVGSKSGVITLKSVKTIGDKAFYGCASIKKVNLSSKVLTKIGANAFYKCTSMTKLVISSTKLNSIGKKAFYGCKKLSNVTIKSKKLTSKNVKANAFKSIAKKCAFSVPSSKVAAYKKIFISKGASKKISVS